MQASVEVPACWCQRGVSAAFILTYCLYVTSSHVTSSSFKVMLLASLRFLRARASGAEVCVRACKKIVIVAKSVFDNQPKTTVNYP